MLDAAGVQFEAVASSVDEEAHKQAVQSSTDLALALARAKAVEVSASRTEDWVIGSDSVVEVNGRLFDKPQSREHAADHLRFFSTKVMQLTSAVALARNGSIDWSHRETTTLHVRQLSDAFIDSYLAAEWPKVGYCVGVFRLEGPGVQLFERIDGDHFTILGMPLLPLLGALRDRKLMPS